jgi:hypothetical protein
MTNQSSLLNPWEQRYDQRNSLQRKADARLQPSKPQQACDIGLFSDDAAQLDLVEMSQQPQNRE